MRTSSAGLILLKRRDRAFLKICFKILLLLKPLCVSHDITSCVSLFHSQIAMTVKDYTYQNLYLVKFK